MEVGKIGFYLVISEFMLADELACFIQDVCGGKLVAVLFGTVLRDKQKSLLFHGVVLEKFQNTLHFIWFEIFFCALQNLKKFSVECGVFFGAYSFGASDSGVDGQIFDKERLSG